MCAVKHRESLIVYQSGRMSLIQEDIKPTQTCCQLCVCCFLEKSSLMNVRQLPTWATVMHTSPTCHLALSITQTEALGSNKTGTWIFPYGILAINWLGHKLPVGLTLSNFTFLRSFLAKATNRLKIHLFVFLLTSFLGQLSVWSWLQLLCSSFSMPFVPY